jgi:ParB-like chromosome segregation protein Spo0J
VHKERLLSDLKDMLQNDKSRSYFFAVSTSALAGEIKELEDVADNLMFTRMEEGMKLYFRIERMKNTDFLKDEVNVPISEDMLVEISKVAEASRKRLIKEIKNVA